MCATIGVFAISNFLVKYMPDSVKRTGVWRKITSVSRYFAYRGYRFRATRYWSPSLGVIALGVVGAVFFFGMCHSKTPRRKRVDQYDSNDTWTQALLLADECQLRRQPAYCDSNWLDGSCLAAFCTVSTEFFDRSDELLIAIPRALSTKANMISALTGVPHEKLQVRF